MVSAIFIMSVLFHSLDHESRIAKTQAIGYRVLRLTGIHEGEPLGLMGFGGSGHLVLPTANASIRRLSGLRFLAWAVHTKFCTRRRCRMGWRH